MQLPQSIKQYIVYFADMYHKYKVDSERLHASKYFISSSLSFYKQTGLIQLAHNDKPGDLLPPMSIIDIKKTEDILSGLHPIDVNSINDLYYLSKDKISSMVVDKNSIKATDQNGKIYHFDLNMNFDHENSMSKRVSFLLGYMQAEQLMKNAYAVNKEKYKIIKDNITSLHIVDLETKKMSLKTPKDILFSQDYLFFSKDDICRIGYICGQMSNF